MKTVKAFVVELTVVVCALFLASCATTEPAKKEAAASPAKNVLYVCGCGADCKCTSLSTKPGKCGCGKDLQALKTVRVEGNDALLCPCSETCKCSVDPKDPTKCGCGKSLKKVSLKGTGVYFCNCGGSCGCCTFSDKPDKCKCGMDLKKAD